MNAACPSATAQPPNIASQSHGRNAVIALVVVTLHAGFIWALQSGPPRTTTELLVPAEVLAQFVDPPVPSAEPVAPSPPTPVRRKNAVAKPIARPQPQLLAIADALPSPNAPTNAVTPLPAPAAPDPVAAAPAMPAGPTAPAVVQLPSNNANYLQNPKPPYPATKRTLGRNR